VPPSPTQATEISARPDQRWIVHVHEVPLREQTACRWGWRCIGTLSQRGDFMEPFDSPGLLGTKRRARARSCPLRRWTYGSIEDNVVEARQLVAKLSK
jgi:hypothetical protein